MAAHTQKLAAAQPCCASAVKPSVCSSSSHTASSSSKRQQQQRSLVIRQSFETDTDTRPRAPDAGPGRWGAPPPPPPPPPPMPKATQGGAPSRREAMFGLLGAGLGVGFTTAFFKTQYPDDEEALEEALDALLENPDFLDLVADEIVFQDYEADNDENNAALSRMRNALSNEIDEQQAAGGGK